jgi:hypothetical protein
MRSDEVQEPNNNFVWIFVGLLVGIASTIGVQYWLSNELGSESETAAAVTAADVPVKTASLAESTGGTGASADGGAAPEPGVMTQSAETSKSPAAGEQIILRPGTTYSESSSGYPIYTGGRAIDSEAEPMVNPETTVGEDEQGSMSQPVGRNGLLANPCVDPMSSKGKAYSSSWQ